MTDREALKLALDVLKAAYIALPKSMFIEDAITAIKEALAQPAQEPEAQAWDEGYRAGIDDERTSEANIGIAGMGMKVEPARNNPYHATPPAAQPAAEESSVAQPVQRVLSGQELIEYQSKHKLESEEYMAALNKYLPVVGVLAQIESKNEACTDERTCVPCYTGQGTCETTTPMPVQEPVEWLTGCPECGMDSGCDCDSGTCNSPQRPWVGLTEEQIDNIIKQHTGGFIGGMHFVQLARAIEAALKEKNHDQR